MAFLDDGGDKFTDFTGKALVEVAGLGHVRNAVVGTPDLNVGEVELTPLRTRRSDAEAPPRRRLNDAPPLARLPGTPHLRGNGNFKPY